ncbi:energy transducer TonB [Flavobacterium sp.]|uniref:energy transducer TonB n=1 Tax=Flavobacterium sp. TaxID=239 RepID=UPI0039E278BF
MIKRLQFVFIFVAMGLYAQPPKDSIYTYQAVEIKSSYPGGMTFFNQYIAENFKIAKHTDFKGGKLLVDFVIDTTGAVSDVRILRDIGFGAADEAKRILPLSEKWIPGKQNMKKVKVRYAFPLTLPAYDPALDVDDHIYDDKEIDELPDYPGGRNAFRMMVAKNFDIPDFDKLSGKLLFSFVVETDGSIGDIKIINDLGYGSGQEIIRVLRLSEKWIPAKKNGKNVRSLFKMPIKFGKE